MIIRTALALIETFDKKLKIGESFAIEYFTKLSLTHQGASMKFLSGLESIGVVKQDDHRYIKKRELKDSDYKKIIERLAME